MYYYRFVIDKLKCCRKKLSSEKFVAEGDWYIGSVNCVSRMSSNLQPCFVQQVLELQAWGVQMFVQLGRQILHDVTESQE